MRSVFNDSLKISKFTRMCMESRSNLTGLQVIFLIQIPLTFSGHCNRYFDIYGWKFTGYQNLICSFSSCWQTFPKANCFRVYKKLMTWPIIAKKKREKKNGGMGSLGRGVPLRPENFDFCYPTSSPGCFSLAFATVFKTGDHFSWPLFLSFWVGGLAQ